MKNITKLFAIAVVILGFSANSFGQTTAVGKAKIVTSLDVTVGSGVEGLDFGTMSANAGTVTVDTDGNRSTGVPAIGNGGSAGTFQIEGGSGGTFGFVFQAGTVTLTAENVLTGVKTMDVTGWTFSIDGGLTNTALITGLPLTGGIATLSVGATLTVNASQEPDTYAGNYIITFNAE